MVKLSSNAETEMWDAWNRFHYLADSHRFQKIFARADLVRMVRDVPGDIVDAGAYKGTSTLQFAHAINAYQPNTRKRVISFDTFDAVFPKAREDEAQTASDHMKTYEATAYGELVKAIENHGLENRVEIVKGDITETMPQYVKDNPGFRISILHCDLDVYPATLETLKAAWHRIVPGGIAVFDEYAINQWGEADAVDEFLATLPNPPRLKMLESSPTPTAYCVKESY